MTELARPAEVAADAYLLIAVDATFLLPSALRPKCSRKTAAIPQVMNHFWNKNLKSFT